MTETQKAYRPLGIFNEIELERERERKRCLEILLSFCNSKWMFHFLNLPPKKGRAFILRGKEEIKTELEGIMKTNDHDVQEYEVSKNIHIFKEIKQTNLLYNLPYFFLITSEFLLLINKQKSRNHFLKKREDLEVVFKENIQKHNALIAN